MMKSRVSVLSWLIALAFVLQAPLAQAGLGALQKAKKAQKRAEQVEKTANTVEDVNQVVGEVVNLKENKCEKNGHVWKAEEKKCYKAVAQSSEVAAEASTEGQTEPTPETQVDTQE